MSFSVNSARSVFNACIAANVRFSDLATKHAVGKYPFRVERLAGNANVYDQLDLDQRFRVVKEAEQMAVMAELERHFTSAECVALFARRATLVRKESVRGAATRTAVAA